MRYSFFNALFLISILFTPLLSGCSGIGNCTGNATVTVTPPGQQQPQNVALPPTPSC